MKIPAKYLRNRLTSDQLEAAGQLRLTYVLRALVRPIVALVKAVKAALGLKKASPAPVITESERSITVRLPGALLTLSGEERAFYDIDSIKASIKGCRADTDVMDTLEGLGFVCRSFHRVGEIDKSLLEDNASFA
jgi:hypothetical protein